jgi:hypothetical protein
LISVQIIRNALAMDLTSLDLPEKRVLRALFELAQRDHPAHPDVLARALDLDVSDVARALTSLATRRLADAERARLTLSGLAAAVQLAPLAPAALSFLRPTCEPRPATLRVVPMSSAGDGEVIQLRDGPGCRRGEAAR